MREMRITTRHGSIDIPNIDSRPPLPDDAIGLALDTLRTMPLNGLRYLPQEGGSGWYIWGGDEILQRADFFCPVQVRYLGDYVAGLQPFLDLPPGFRFLTDNRGRQKVWFDGSLLDA
ncbi:MAG TPA: hypothetical protein VIS31_05990 [Woeseiaceae bacterium]